MNPFSSAYVDAWPARFAETLVFPSSSFKWEYGVTPMSHLSWPLFSTVGYLASVAALHSWMKDRKAMDLGGFPKYHNLFLCLWSGLMWLGITFEVLVAVATSPSMSLSGLVCDPARVLMGSGGRLEYWAWMYYISKTYELIDTWVMILKHKPLTVLHVWHHAVMLWLPWSWVQGSFSLSWWGMWANTLVHVLMYWYYYQLSVGNRDVWYKIYITKMQLAQFFSVFVLIFVWANMSVEGLALSPQFPFLTYSASSCAGDPAIVYASQAVNVSFLVLFTNFFYQTYVEKAKRKRKQRAPKKQE